MFSKLITVFHTLSYLKPVQAIYQVKNRLSKVGALASFELEFEKTEKLNFFNVSAIHPFLKFESDELRFEFLNLSNSYAKNAIDWNDQSHGKLWNYNLQYLDFLKQEEISIEIKTTLVNEIYDWLWSGKLPVEPYPVSLRIMNMIRFLEQNTFPEEESKRLKKYLLAELNYISQNLEYHLLANHLLENAFAFWMGAIYFQNETWINKSESLLKAQLEEQILPDGAHYEIAPMYHKIILFRVLESYYLTPDNFLIKNLLKSKAELMLSWLNKMKFSNGDLPHFNDTTDGIAYQSNQLIEIGLSLGLSGNKIDLKESGYRVFEADSIKLIADVEGIKPSYQPGHAHADTFSFVLHHEDMPVIVDPGISTYNISKRRSWERSTIAHNTVSINRKNSSDVWAGFRVGKRARVKFLEDNAKIVTAEHNGFGTQKHERSFRILDNGFQIKDKIKNRKKTARVEAMFYFHPEIQPVFQAENVIKLLHGLILEVEGASKLEILDYQFCLGYNKLSPAKYLLATFKEETLNSTFLFQ